MNFCNLSDGFVPTHSKTRLPFLCSQHDFLICLTQKGKNSSVVLVERSSETHPHETDAILLEPLVADLLGGHENMPDAGLRKREERGQSNGVGNSRFPACVFTEGL